MSAVIDAGHSAHRPRRALGLYAIIAYSTLVGASPHPWLGSELPLGWFTLEGRSAQRAMVIWSAVWGLVVIGLFVRKFWGYRLALAVFGLHVLIMVANTLRWFAYNQASVPIAFQVAIWPMLQGILPALLAMAYLQERRDIFSRPGR